MSAAWGGATFALSMLMAHHPDAKVWLITECAPMVDDEGRPIVMAELQKRVAGYASRVANLVNLHIFNAEEPVPPTLEGEESGPDTDTDAEDKKPQS